MLILTRRLDETLTIGEGENVIEVTILGIKGNQVSIGVEAPKDVAVHRAEVYDRIQAAKAEPA